MNLKERIEAVIHHKSFDRIPWTMYKSYPPWGETERKFRNIGLTMVYQHFPITKIVIPGVEVSEEGRYILNISTGKNIIIRKFTTPIGKISCQHEFIINSLQVPG